MGHGGVRAGVLRALVVLGTASNFAAVADHRGAQDIGRVKASIESSELCT